MGHGESGSVGSAGPLVTAGGLVFVAATIDPYLRAYDATSGTELWRGRLPGPANATPMSYTIKGKQFVVIGVGGTFWGGVPEAGTRTRDDSVVAFALPGKSK